MDGDTSRDMRYAPPQAHVEDVEASGGELVLASRMLLIFRASRRCLHDLIADTIVVKA